MPKSILFALLLLVATTAYGRRTIDTYFISAPTQLLPQLDANNRKDLIDLFDAGLESRITGPLGGNIEIGSIDDRQITVHFSPASTLQIALLPTADTVGVIAVIHTVDLPAPDSRITFYDTQWKPIENNELFIGTILCIAVAALLLFCTIVAVLSLSKGQGSRSVFFTRVTAFLALACSIVASVMFAKASSWLVGAGAILPVLCTFVVFVGSLVLPSDKAN